jgi:DNA-binding MarR family transcriptional regulator
MYIVDKSTNYGAIMKSFGRLIAILYRRSLVYVNEALKEYGLSAGEQPFLTSLYRKEGVTQEDLTRMLHIDKAATARTLQSLETKGFVERRKSTSDRRCNRIYLTNQGRESKRYVLPILARWSEILVDGFDEHTKATLYEQLETMVSNAEEQHGK